MRTAPFKKRYAGLLVAGLAALAHKGMAQESSVARGLAPEALLPTGGREELTCSNTTALAPPRLVPIDESEPVVPCLGPRSAVRTCDLPGDFRTS